MNVVRPNEDLELSECFFNLFVLLQLLCVPREEHRIKVLLVELYLFVTLHECVPVLHEVALHKDMGPTCQTRDRVAAIRALSFRR